MPKRVVVSDAAYADLDDTFSYISSDLCAPGAAAKLIDKIFDSMELLNDFPLIGAIPNNKILAAQNYRLLTVDNFIVFYIPKDNEVHVIRIIYGRRDWETIIGNDIQ
jgi:toxin ParE1/3/4